MDEKSAVGRSDVLLSMLRIAQCARSKPLSLSNFHFEIKISIFKFRPVCFTAINIPLNAIKFDTIFFTLLDLTQIAYKKLKN